MILVIDNYDSFTWNLVQYLAQVDADITVRRNDAVSVEGALALRPSHVVISPGPGRPENAGITVPLILAAGEARVPVLGVCLGHQAIAVAYGGRVIRADRPVHGKTSVIEHDGAGVFAGIGPRFQAGRYHSLVVCDDPLPPALEIAARVEGRGAVMALRHRTLPVHGVQFHPESVLTQAGQRLLANFLGR